MDFIEAKQPQLFFDFLLSFLFLAHDEVEPLLVGHSFGLLVLHTRPFDVWHLDWRNLDLVRLRLSFLSCNIGLTTLFPLLIEQYHVSLLNRMESADSNAN